MKSLFHYQAFDSSGKPVEGSMEGENADQVRSQLLKVGLTLKSVERIESAPPSPARGSKIRPGEFGELAGHLADLVTTGLPLSGGLRAIAAEHTSQRYRGAILSLADEIDRGCDLQDALQSINAPEDLKLLLRSGIRSDNLGSILQDYLYQVQAQRELRRTVAMALLYPLVLFGLSLFILFFLLVLVVPKFSSIFEGFGVEVPALTNVVFELSAVVIRWRGWELVQLLVGLCVCGLVFRFLVSARLRRLMLHWLPIIGPVIQWSALARFCHHLSLLIENQVPMPEALKAAGEASRDAYYCDAAEKMAAQVVSGHDLGAVASKQQAFPPSLVQVLSWPNAHSTLADSLKGAGEMFEARSRLQSTWLIGVAEPFVVLSTGILVFWCVVGLFLPMFKLLNQLS